MRAGLANFASQHTLSQEAASLLNTSLILAKRRGHAQLTPLHVAATLLTSSSSSSKAAFFKQACIKSQPLLDTSSIIHHSRALELCFNVALNRLPSSTSHHHDPIMHGKVQHVFLSNALVAALKRTQACVKRGTCVEQQNSNVAGVVRVEHEQLVLSILDDPSVSRVMKEAGFSSTKVKISLENSFSLTDQLNPFVFSTDQHKCVTNYLSLKEDVEVVFRALAGKNRTNVVIIGDSLSIFEGFVSEVMRRLEKGAEYVPEELRSITLVNFKVSSSLPLRLIKRRELEMNLCDLKRKVDYAVSSGGKVIIYTGDLKWIINEVTNSDEADYLVEEMGKMVSSYNVRSSGSVRLMCVASHETYLKCQMRQVPLSVQWSLQAVSVPCCNEPARLSLSVTSGLDSRIPRTVARFRRQQKPCHNIEFKTQPDILNLNSLKSMDGNELKISLSLQREQEHREPVIQMRLLVHKDSAFDLGYKRKADSDPDFPVKSKVSRAFDLNTKAVEYEERESSSSDLTLEETLIESRNTTALVENMDQESRTKQMILSKFRSSLHDEASGVLLLSGFSIEETLLERVFERSGNTLYHDWSFEQWIKDVFRKSLCEVNDRLEKGKTAVCVRLCLGQSCSEDRFMGTCLPNGIQVSIF